MNLRRSLAFLALAALLPATAGGIAMFVSLRQRAHREIIEAQGERLKDLAVDLDQSLASHSRLAATLAGLPAVVRRLEASDPATVAAADRLLDLMRATQDLEACYLVGLDGVVLASSNLRAPDSFVGRNCAFRPYVQAALGGRPSVHGAVGVTSGRPGFYFAHPVRSAAGRILGLAVLKDGTGEFLREMEAMNLGPVALADPQGVVFAASPPEWQYQLLWDHPASVRRAIAASRQFGGGPFAWLGFQSDGEGRVRDRQGRRLDLLQRPVQGLPGWSYLALVEPDRLSAHPVAQPLRRAGTTILLAGLVYAGCCGWLLWRISREFHQRLQLTEALRRTSDELQALVRAAPLPIVMVDNDGRVGLWNPAAERTFGWATTDVLGCALTIIPDHLEAEFQEIRRQLLEGRVFTAHPTQRLHKDGRLLDVALSTAPLLDASGAVAGTLALYEDITARKAAEQERRRGLLLQSIGMLAGGLAHDFNNLLAGLMSTVALLRRKAMPREEADRHLETAEGLCRQARELTRRLISFAPGGAPVLAPCAVDELARAAVEEALDGTPVQAAWHWGETPLVAAVDRLQLRQVFLNLARNAVEAMPEGGQLRVAGTVVQLDPGSASDLPAGSYLQIAFTDTGAGIPAEDLSKLFDPYFSTKRTFSDKGVGLGLTVCHAVATRHGGRIRVASEAGKGTTFTVLLPVNRLPGDGPSAR